MHSAVSRKKHNLLGPLLTYHHYIAVQQVTREQRKRFRRNQASRRPVSGALQIEDCFLLMGTYTSFSEMRLTVITSSNDVIYKNNPCLERSAGLVWSSGLGGRERRFSVYRFTRETARSF